MNIQERTLSIKRILSSIMTGNIRLNSDYINQLMSDGKHTIDPEKIIKEDGPNTVTLFGYSFGPFDCDSYLRSDCRVVYLLKEPVLRRESYENGDRGFHDQAKEYLFEYINTGKMSPPYPQIARNVYSIFHAFDEESKVFKDSDNEMTEAYNLLLNKTAIINVNNYPSLGGSSNNTLIDKWAKENKNTIVELIKLLEPTIIISGTSLGKFINNKNDTCELFDGYGKNCKKCSENNQEYKDCYYSEKTLFINGYHPSAPTINKDKHHVFIRSVIGEWPKARDLICI